MIATTVTPAILAAHKDDPRAVFEHIPTGAPPRPVIYARIDRESVRFPDDPAGARPFVFLTYHVVFRTSGLPAGLAWWKALPVSVFASLEDWHQLDHYTAVTLALDEATRPVAVTVQQHNYLRTWLVAREWPWPADDRIAVDVAIRSNELYPHRPGRTRHRAVPFLNGDSVDYLLGDDGAPFFAGEDVTDPAREIDPPLAFLAPADPFYTFKGFLGEKRLLPGRSGPPGAEYNTLPRYKPKAVQLVAFHWRERDPLYPGLVKSGEREGPGSGADRLAARFFAEWQCATARIETACAR